jgi:hypothetical protein
MDGLLLGGTGFAVAIVMTFLEVPVAVALGLVGVIGTALIIGTGCAMAVGATTVWDSVTNDTLTMLPLFVLMGNLLAQSGLSARLDQSMAVLIGHRRSGLALATIGASAGFGMLSGSSLATTATMGRIALPEMQAAVSLGGIGRGGGQAGHFDPALHGAGDLCLHRRAIPPRAVAGHSRADHAGRDAVLSGDPGADLGRLIDSAGAGAGCRGRADCGDP